MLQSTFAGWIEKTFGEIDETDRTPMVRGSSTTQRKPIKDGSAGSEEGERSQEESEEVLEPATKTMDVTKSTKLFNIGTTSYEEYLMHIKRIALRDGPRCGNKGTDKGNNKKGKDKDNNQRRIRIPPAKKASATSAIMRKLILQYQRAIKFMKIDHHSKPVKKRLLDNIAKMETTRKALLKVSQTKKVVLLPFEISLLL